MVETVAKWLTCFLADRHCSYPLPLTVVMWLCWLIAQEKPGIQIT